MCKGVDGQSITITRVHVHDDIGISSPNAGIQSLSPFHPPAPQAWSDAMRSVVRATCPTLLEVEGRRSVSWIRIFTLYVPLPTTIHLELYYIARTLNRIFFAVRLSSYLIPTVENAHIKKDRRKKRGGPWEDKRRSPARRSLSLSTSRENVSCSTTTQTYYFLLRLSLASHRINQISIGASGKIQVVARNR